jgi:hypothetical protein
VKPFLDVPSLSDPAAPPMRYACMIGSGFCGSTLLAFLLNAHPACASVGEVTGLIEGLDLRTYACSCGRRFVECPFWRSVGERMAALGSPLDLYRPNWETHFRASASYVLDVLLARSLRSDALNRLRDAAVDLVPGLRARIDARLARAGGLSLAFARACLDLTGKSVFVDSSKDHQRPRHLARVPGLDLRVIHLVRDARANSASIMKHHGHGAARSARIWRRANLEADRALRTLPPERWLRIRYDELCARPQSTYDRLCDFLGVARAPLPDDFRASEHHIIGNEMRAPGGSGRIREDRAWEEKLGAADLAAIAAAAGAANRYLGFDWPASSR